MKPSSSSRSLALAALLAAASSFGVDAVFASSNAGGGGSGGGRLRKAKVSGGVDDAEKSTASVLDLDAVERSLEEVRDMDREASRSLMMDHMMFQPLSCNENVDWSAACAPGTATSLSSLVSAAAGSTVKIDCGACALVDTADGSTLEIPGGIDVEGMLRFPHDAHVTLRTTRVVVQGILKSDAPPSGTTIPAASGRSVKILMYGTDDQTFVPHSENAMACGGMGESCGVGKKAFVVAGGSLDIEAVNPACPSWVPLLATDSTIPPKPDPTLPAANVRDTPVPEGCTNTLLEYDFKIGDTHTTFVGVTDTGIFPMDPALNSVGDNAYFKGTVGGHWSYGPHFPIPDPSCWNSQAVYTFSVRIRLSHPDGVTKVKCDASTPGNQNWKIDLRKASDPNWRFKLSDGSHYGRCKVAHSGEWFVVTIRTNYFTSDVHDYVTLFGQGLQGGTNFEIDWVKMIQEEPAALTPRTADDCADLVEYKWDEENAIVESGMTHPWYSESKWHYAEVLSDGVDPDTGDENKFIRFQRSTTWNWQGIYYYPGGVYGETPKKESFCTPGIVEGDKYQVKFRYRNNCDNPRGASVQFFWTDAAGVRKNKMFADFCPSAGSGIWTDCSVTWDTSEPSSAGVGSGTDLGIKLMVATSQMCTQDYDDISVVRVPSLPPQNQIVIPSEAASCWKAGSELALTSGTYDQDDAAGTYTVVSSDSSTGVLTLHEAVPFTVSEADDPDFPVEVVQLNRNFKLDAEADDSANPLHGGHLMILHTDAIQKLQGVEIKNFGQQGNLGKYPIHFHMCDAVKKGTAVSRNVVRASHQRGVVIHGTHNVTVSDNVLYDVKGHGYFLEDGVEQFNRFERNLGAMIKPVTTLVPSGNVESDNDPAVFWMSNTMNYWEGNVAAGAHRTGYWIEPQLGGPRGASKDMSKYSAVNRIKTPLLHFKDNTAHSNRFCGMDVYPNFYDPTEEAQIVNFRSYKNKECGIFLHVSTNLALRGGVMANNKRGVWDRVSEFITVDGTTIVGHTPEYSKALDDAGRGGEDPCDGTAEGKELVGVMLNANRHQRTNAAKGLTMKNVQFSHFSCGSKTKVIEHDAGHTYEFLSDAPSTLGSLTFDPDTVSSVLMSSCAVDIEGGLGQEDIAVEDVDGSLNPAGNGVPGFIVSDVADTVARSTSSSGGCTSLGPDTCLTYCENVCLQNFVVNTVATGPDARLKLASSSGTYYVDKHVASDDVTDFKTRGKYSFSLPEGDYDVTFEDADGVQVYVEFESYEMMASPECTKGVTTLNFVRPAPTSDHCNELVKNTDFEDGTLTGYQVHRDSGRGQILEVVDPGHGASQYALKLTRDWYREMIDRALDTACLIEGATYDVKLYYRIVDENNAGVDCPATGCPELYILHEPHVYVSTGGTVGTYNAAEWNEFAGSFTVTAAMASAPQVAAVFFDKSTNGYGGELSGNLIIDDFTITKSGSSSTS